MFQEFPKGKRFNFLTISSFLSKEDLIKQQKDSQIDWIEELNLSTGG